MTVLIPILGFVLGVALVFVGVTAMRYLPGMMTRRRIQARMKETAGEPAAGSMTSSTLIKQVAEGPLPGVDRMLARTTVGPSLSRLIEQSGLRLSVGGFALISVASGVLLATVGGMVTHAPWGTIVGIVGLFLPGLLLVRRRRVRLYRFEELFPEALDLLSRAIKAGHALTTALGMVADEAPDPIGPEFRKTYDEQNFGLPLRDALANLSVRVPLLDVRFFVTAVLIQRETGGNLSEILDNLSHVVRERFKVLRQVRVHTAHGRFTGYVLLALPAALAVVLTFINREHMMLLFQERMGQMMVGAAVVLQIIGYLWIKKIVKIEV